MRISVVDSHTEGEPTRVIVAGYPQVADVGRLRSEFDALRTAVVCEPRGSDAWVAALLVEPSTDADFGVVFMNNVGYLGMCVHGTIGVVETMRHLGRVSGSLVRLETPVGTVHAELLDDGQIAVTNVPSYRYREAVRVSVPGVGDVVGDIAWGGNWFFLVDKGSARFGLGQADELTAEATAIRMALARAGITGEGGAEIDHIELFGEPHDPSNHSRNFVLCPGLAYDRSPCGTGTSAKVACLAAAGKLAPGQAWRQEGICGGVFSAQYRPDSSGKVVPTVAGRAWITAESTLILDPTDPFRHGIAP